MPESPILETVERRARDLVAERLRSSAIVISRLRDLIEQAHSLGHSHAAIYGRLRAGGIATSWNTYRSSLARARARSQIALDGPPVLIGRETTERAAPSRMCDAMYASEPVPSPSATHTMDALRRARQVASKDYSRIAIAHYRKERP